MCELSFHTLPLLLLRVQLLLLPLLSIQFTPFSVHLCPITAAQKHSQASRVPVEENSEIDRDEIFRTPRRVVVGHQIGTAVAALRRVTHMATLYTHILPEEENGIRI